jgi:hypothetical protein
MRVFSITPSLRYRLFLIFILLLSGGVLVGSPLPVLIKGVFFIFFLLYGYHLLQRPGILRSLTHLDQRLWMLEKSDGQRVRGKLLGDSLMTQWAVILRFKIEGHFFSETHVIACDATPKDRFRQLLVILRTH